MWQSRLFGSLPILLDFVNAGRLAHDQFKIAIVPPRIWQRRASPRYYLIYRGEDAGVTLPVGVAEVETSGTVEEAAAVDTAARIIADALHTGEGPAR